MTRIVFAIVPLAVIAIGIIVVVQFNGASSETSGAVMAWRKEHASESENRAF